MKRVGIDTTFARGWVIARVKIRNPVFDVIPPDHIDLIITERGIIPPSAAYTVIQELFE